MLRLGSFSLLPPSWGGSLVMSSVDNFPLLTPAWGSSFISYVTPIQCLDLQKPPRGSALVELPAISSFAAIFSYANMPS